MTPGKLMGKTTFRFNQTMDELDIIKDRISDYLDLFRVDEDLVSLISLSVYEVLVNIVDHCEEKNRDKPVDVELAIKKNFIEITVSNYGEKFDITKVTLPDIETHFKSGKNRGLGIYFIRTLMDKVEYNYRDNINILKLVKKTDVELQG